MSPYRFVVVSFVMLMGSRAFAQDAAPFLGKWTGKYTNSMGGSGPNNLILEENKGKLSGDWGGDKVSWRVVNKHIIELHAKDKDRTYCMLATVDGDTMTFLYVCASKIPSEGGTYSGHATMKRTK